MIVTFLGTGTSYGVPFVGCTCAVCRSRDPRNKRLRASILVESGPEEDAFRILVDTGPDLRQQLLREEVARIDAILWTHWHNDHVIGLDDMRPITNICGYIPGYGSQKTIEHLQRIFEYALTPNRPEPFFPRLSPHIVQPEQVLQLGPFSITPLRIAHGRADILAYKFQIENKTFVYATDCSHIYNETWPHLENADLLVLDALRHQEHPTHFSLGQALAAVEKTHARRALFTHMAHDLDHEETNASLPPHVRLAFDGQRVEI